MSRISGAVVSDVTTDADKDDEDDDDDDEVASDDEVVGAGGAGPGDAARCDDDEGDIEGLYGANSDAASVIIAGSEEVDAETDPAPATIGLLLLVLVLLTLCEYVIRTRGEGNGAAGDKEDRDEDRCGRETDKTEVASESGELARTVRADPAAAAAAGTDVEAAEADAEGV